MDVPVTETEVLLADLVRRVEGGEDVVLTRHGRPVARVVPVVDRPTAADRRAVLDAIRTAARQRASPGPSAARSQDFLYGDDGLPG